MSRLLALGISSLLLAACSTGEGPSERIEAKREPIIAGDADAPPTSVVGIISELEDGGSSRIRCTGTLVAPNVVLTARHCVEDVEIVSCLAEFTGEQKWPKLAVGTDTARHEVLRIHFPPTNEICGDDIALFVLTAPVSPAEAPVAEVRASAPPVEGEGYSAVGYGRRCGDGTPECAGGTRLRRDGLTIECVGCRPKAFRGTSDSICSGDSGGPAFDTSGVVVGVAAASGIGCTTSYYNRVDEHGAFLRKTVRDDTTAAGIAPPEWTNDPVDAGASDAAPPPPAEPAAPVVEAESPPAAPSSPPRKESGCSMAAHGRPATFACGALSILALAGALRARRRPQ